MTTIAPFRYATLAAWVKAELQDPVTDLPVVVPGPMSATNQDAWDGPEPTIVLTLGNGPGLELEGLFDRVAVHSDVAGEQNDPDSAEDLALALDHLFCSITTPVVIGGVRVLAGTRSGGRPAPTTVDDGDRWHFVCSHILRVESGH